AQAAPISPSFQTFGDLPQATFGGSGIPTNPTAFSEFIDPNTGNGLLLGLSATQRFNNPAPTTDGAGTYFVEPAFNDGFVGAALGAGWNFNFYVEVTGSGSQTIADFEVALLYDLDAGVDTDESALGVIDLSLLTPTSTLEQGSQNATFAFLAGPAVPGLTPPGATFNPLAPGEYTFALQSSLGSVSIQVTAVPLPTTALLLLAGLGGLGLVRARRGQA
ncbi:MAG: hypothetical protein AAGI34_18330, partial [Pseudomonadota bacterium]